MDTANLIDRLREGQNLHTEFKEWTVMQESVRDEEGRVVMVVNVPKGEQRPYRTNRGIYYVRTTSGRRQASREELLRLFQSSESFTMMKPPYCAAVPRT